MENINAIKVTISAVLAALTALWGWFGWLVLAWFVCMAVDYLTGTAAASRAGEWSSKIARDGVWHKIGSIAAVLVAVILDAVIRTILTHAPGISLPFDYEIFFTPLIVIWYVLTECGSIIENAGALGAPIPKWLTKAIKSLGDAVDATAGGGDQENTNDETD